MKAIVLLAMIITLLAIWSQTSESASLEEKIEFQEMRGDTVVIKGGCIVGKSYGDQSTYRWVMFQDDAIVGIYTSRVEVPYLLAVIKPGRYRLIRYTDHYDHFQQVACTRSNTIEIEYQIPEAYENSKSGDER